MSAPVTSQRDFLRIADLSPEELRDVLSLAEEMKADPTTGRGVFTGETVACYFAKPSTRTRVSFEGAAARLGLVPIMLRPDELQLGRGEPISDTAKVLSSYTVAIVVRTFGQEEVDAMAEHASVPVVNALTDLHHPCQALADLMTIEERFGGLAGLKLAYIGDGNNVAHSLMEGAARVGMDIVLATPSDYVPDPQILLDAEVTARRHGCSVAVTDDPREAVRGADVVYTDVWVSMGEEEEGARRMAALAPFRVTGDLMRLASDEAVFMHCLPAHRGQEVDADVIDGPQSIVFEQAANRMPTEQAILFDLIGDRLGGSAPG
jgi:ornithine carbamoyltransferase